MEETTKAAAGRSTGYEGLRQLDRLVGTWRVTGPEVDGIVTYEWMDGGYFLLQRVDLTQAGQQTRGVEIIGYERAFGASEPSTDIRSRYFDNSGNTFDYTYEIDGDTLTIWGGLRGSPAYYRGTFSPDGTKNSGGWVYPDGGGYQSTMTRVAPNATTHEEATR